MIPIYFNNEPYTDQIKAFRVSKDGALAACVLKSNDILVYRVSAAIFNNFNSSWMAKVTLFLRRLLRNQLRY